VQREDEMLSVRVTMLAAGFLAATAGLAAAPARADDDADTAFAKRMFAGSAAGPTSYACFIRRYDAAHLAQHPKQKVSAMKLLITAEKVPDDKALQYSFRLGVNFRDRAGDYDSSGDCGHAPNVKTAAADTPAADQPPPLEAGIDFFCGVDCDGGGISVGLTDNDASIIVKPLDAIRIWKGKNPDEAASTALKAGADDKVFRLDRTKVDDCSSLAADRKELAAMRHK
jgi:hypothetical protein